MWSITRRIILPPLVWTDYKWKIEIKISCSYKCFWQRKTCRRLRKIEIFPKKWEFYYNKQRMVFRCKNWKVNWKLRSLSTKTTSASGYFLFWPVLMLTITASGQCWHSTEHLQQSKQPLLGLRKFSHLKSDIYAELGTDLPDSRDWVRML